ncbi:DNA-binding protein [Streptomyces longispororuber]|uniref:nSTAND1 domain-containing NTPase n=1 Tax=Streptomyces longispororuber TaxID=68230 RepID=UPI0033E10D5D
MEQFAYALRKLRQEAGGPTYREMARIAHYSVTVLSQAASGTQLPSLAVTLAYVRACKGDAAQWERQWKEAHEAVAAAERGGARSSSPYRGLARFEPDDHDVFFGRDRLVAKAEQLVGQRRFAAILGPSGSGKSSLLRAGLIPVLRDKHRSLSAIRLLTPGEHPLRAHAKALRPAEGDADTVIVIDQFEEVFTLCHDAAERAQFIDHLLGSCDPRSRIRVVVAVRADFYGRCAEHRGLAEALSDSSLLVGPMTSAELREAIVKPAQSAGLIVERALTARLLSEIKDEPGGLPLLSHVLRETWSHRRGRALTLEAYEAAGGLHGAIAQTAETVYHQFTATQGPLAQLLLLRLITPGEGVPDTRRPVARAELDLAADTGDIDQVLNKLARARLITLDNGMVDLAHEALITGWPRLHRWIEEDRERLRRHRRLTASARNWQEQQRDKGALLRGTQLTQAADTFCADGRQNALTRLERDFIEASAAARARRTRIRRIRVGSLSLLVVLALVAGALAWQQKQSREQERLRSVARRLAEVAGSLRDSDPKTAQRLSVASYRMADIPESRSAVVEAAVQREQDVFHEPDADPVARGFLSGDGRTWVSVGQERVRRWDVRTHRQLGRPLELEVRPARVADKVDRRPPALITDDAQALALGTNDGMQIWNLASGRRTGDLLPVSLSTYGSGRFSPSGRHLAVVSTSPRRVFRLWDLERGQVSIEHRSKAEDEDASGPFAPVAISPDDRWMALCNDGRSVKLWDIAERRKAEPRRPLKASGRWCDGLEFSADSRVVALMTSTGIRAWDRSSGEEEWTIRHPGLQEMTVTDDGRFLAATDEDELLVWRTSHPKSPVLRYAMREDTPARRLRWDPDGRTLRFLWGTSAVRSFDVRDLVDAAWQDRPLHAALFSPDGGTLATVHRDAGRDTVELGSVGRGRATAAFTGLRSADPQARSGAPSWGPTVSISQLMAFSPDSAFFSYAAARKNDSYGPAFTWWDTRHRRQRGSMMTKPVPASRTPDVSAIAVGPQAETLFVSRLNGQRIEAWDLRRRRLARTMPGRLSVAVADEGDMALRPDGRVLVTTHDQLFNTRTGAVTHRGLGQHPATAVAFSPRGRYLAAADTSNAVTLWDGHARRRLGVLTSALPLRDSVYTEALAFSPDERLLATADTTGAVQVWDLTSRKPLGPRMRTPGIKVRALSFSPDNSTLRVSSAHVRLHAYTIAPKKAAAEVCRRIGGSMSRRDWATHIPDVAYRKIC